MLKPSSVIWHTSMSLDGFVADRNDRLDALLAHWGPNPLASEIMGNLGAILSGRRGYDISLTQPVEEAYGGQVRVPEFIVTRRPPPPEHSPAYRFVSGHDLPGAMAVARAAAGGKHIVILGQILAAAFMRAGLVDYLVIHVVPLLLGAGVPLFRSDDTEPVQMEPVSVSQAGAITNLVYRPVRAAEASGQVSHQT